MNYLEKANSPLLYITVGIILLFVAATCVIFMIKSYKAGLKIGMDKKVLNKAITSSMSFTFLPSFSILVGVIALSGTLGVPISWLRLSVIGNLQYEATVANIAAEQMGTKLDASILNLNNLLTIMLTMTVGIIWGGILSLFTLKAYTNKLTKAVERKSKDSSKKSFASFAMIAMMIGLCATFIGSYTASFIALGNYIPILTALISALFMFVFESLSKYKTLSFLDSFSLSLSMLFAMVGAVLINQII